MNRPPPSPTRTEPPCPYPTLCRSGSKVSAVGIARNEETLEAQTYPERLVGQLDERLALIVDPMLATGGSMVATIDLLKKAGCRNIRALVLVAAPEEIGRAHV